MKGKELREIRSRMGLTQGRWGRGFGPRSRRWPEWSAARWAIVAPIGFSSPTWRGRSALIPKCLTPEQVAELLHISRRKVLSLDIPKVRVGSGRGKIRFNEDDVRDYLRSHTEYPVTKGERNANGVQKRPGKVGLQVLPSRETLEKIRLGHGAGGEKRGGGAPH